MTIPQDIHYNTIIVVCEYKQLFAGRGEEALPHPGAAVRQGRTIGISLTPFERQFMDFGDAIKNKRRPRISGEEGLAALEIVDAIYRSCRTGAKVELAN